jgi:membrane protease YdiL (CAAX protease family)
LAAYHSQSRDQDCQSRHQCHNLMERESFTADIKESCVTESFLNFKRILVELQFQGEAIAILAAVMGIVVYLMWRPHGIPRHLVGPQRWPEIPWQLADVMFAFFMVVFLGLLWEATPWSHPKLEPSGYAAFQLSAAASAAWSPWDHGISGGFLTWVGALESFPAESARRVAEVRAYLFNQASLFPLLIVLLLGMMFRMSGAKLYQVGLHLAHWRENITLGYLTWMIAVPIVVLVFAFVRLDFWETLWGKASPHPIAIALEKDSTVTTFFLALFVSCIVAPVKEELLLRGILQPYLVRMPIVSDLMVLFSILWALGSLMAPGTGPDHGAGIGPLLFIGLVAPGYYWFERWTKRWLPEPGVARGIFATSLLFAAMHFVVWPTPIPIFVLSLFLGTLAYRTGSLVSSITLHILFNATSMLAIALAKYLLPYG